VDIFCGDGDACIFVMTEYIVAIMRRRYTEFLSCSGEIASSDATVPRYDGSIKTSQQPICPNIQQWCILRFGRQPPPVRKPDDRSYDLGNDSLYL